MRLTTPPPVVGQLGFEFRSGQYYGPQWGAPGTVAPVLNSLHVMPFVVSAPGGFTFTHVGIDVTLGLPTAVMRLGVWRDDNGWPGALFDDLTSAGTLDVSATALAIRAKTVTLPPGLWWVGGVMQSASSTIRNVAGVGQFIPLGTSPYQGGNKTGLSKTGVSGALPDPFGTPTGINYGFEIDLKAA